VTAAIRLSEDAWQSRITDLLDLRGWLWIHIRPARTTQGWRTPISGPLGKGWPDIIAVRGDRLVALELKSARGRVSPEQRGVIDALAVIPGVTAMVARPADWAAVQELLS
jgi:hypothetical protein